MKTITLTLLVATVLAAQGGKQQAAFLMTGRAWVAWPEFSKLTYILGAQDGLRLAAAWYDPIYTGNTTFGIATGFLPGDYVKEMDTFYKDTENLTLPVGLAYSYCNLKLKGTQTKEDLEQRLIEMRKTMAK
jgi:hypothetical protein